MHPDFVKSVEKKFRIKTKLGRCILAECLCTAFLCYAGFNCTAQSVLSNRESGDFLASAIGWGLSITFAVQMGFNISGSHCNCSVSFFMFTLGELPFLHFIYYSLAQFVGAFLGSGLTYLQYYDQINAFDGGIRAVNGPTATAGIFATYPHPNLTFTGAFIDQTMCTTFLCIIIGTITEPKNKIPRAAQPPLFGAMITLLTLGYGFNAGNAMNPARDLGPRLFTFCIGYGKEVFSHFDYSWWIIPVVCPLIGAVFGTWIYRIFFGANIDHHPDDDDDDEVLPRNNVKNISPLNLSIKNNPTKIWPPTKPPPPAAAASVNFIVDFSKKDKNLPNSPNPPTNSFILP